MADAVRWDALPEYFQKHGTVVKTIAASLSTHTSLPSMVTGLSPERHGVMSWRHRLPEIPNLLELSEYDIGYFMPGDESIVNDGTFAVMRQTERRRISELSSGWIYFERHHGGHAPYQRFGWDDWSSFISDFAGEPQKLQEYYNKSVEYSAKIFQKRVSEIEERGELDETLIIYLSDHGEYLAEDGLVGHTSPILPEGVYVPMCFMHPDIPSTIYTSGVSRHIDLFPTILGCLGEETPDFVDGVDLRHNTPQQGVCSARLPTYSRFFPDYLYDASSLWDSKGGYVLNRTSFYKRVLCVGGLLGGSNWKSKHLRRSISKFPLATHHYIAKQHKFGTPDFSWTHARKELSKIEAQSAVADQVQETISPEMQEHLEQLGYL